ncbi:MAG: glycosyltransferase family protein, partial [Microthrixaceae bacterium]
MRSLLPPRPVPVLVTVRDRLAPLEQLVAWLERLDDAEVLLLDNDSSYPPLLRYLASSPHRVVRLGRNLGPRAAWLSGIAQSVGLRSPYVVTDPDVVPEQSCPLDVLDHFAGLLERHPRVGRVGFGLRIDDLPAANPRTADVVTWESQFWEREVEQGVYEADVDTTFALYRPGVAVKGSGALRTGEPYVAR